MAAFDLQPTTTAADACQPVYVDNNRDPQIDPDCITSAESSATIHACQPVYVDNNRDAHIDPDCITS